MKNLLLFLAAGLLALCLQSQGAPPPPAPSVLKPTFAGSWYSSDPKELASSIDAMLLSATPDFKGPPLALIQPHAGYAYSAKTMAYGAATLKGSGIERVVILGPSHRVLLKNVICVPESSAMETPLGTTSIDIDFVAKLRENQFVVANDKVHLGEHSVQMQLPMLQRALPNFKVVPIITGSLDEPTKAMVANVLLSLCDSKTIIIASSDFTHYGASFDYLPFRDDVKDNIKKLDMGAFDRIKAIDPFGFRNYIETTGDTVCGECGIGILLRILPKDAAASLLHYDRSGDQTGDFSSSVSYLSIAFSGKWPDARKSFNAASPETEALLSDSDRRALLEIARKSLGYGLATGKALPAGSCGVAISPAMRKVMGAFVTLKIDGQLRGCIGEIYPIRPLCEAVAARAVDSALHDQRFSRMTVAELSKVEIEVSALTPPRKIESYKDIVLGRHGVTIFKDGASAVFLPQVAPEQGWNLEQMLTHLCIKAGIPQDSWRSGADFSVFEAIVFSESSMPESSAMEK